MQVKEKIREISLALVKISVGVRRSQMRQRLETLAFEILEDAAKGDFETLLKRFELVFDFLDFGRLIYEIEPLTARHVSDECGKVKEVIKKVSGIDFESDIRSVFYRKEAKENEVVKKKRQRGNAANNPAKNTAINPVTLRVISRSETINQANNAVPLRGISRSETNDDQEQLNAEMRQAAIVDKIRQWSDKQVQLKDLAAEFSTMSERTLRYDLQKLCSQGVLERIGAGGPNNYYKIRVL